MDEIIFISISSYRDPDLINTVKSCFEKAANKSRLFFSIFSQAEDSEHADLSFIPENQIRYKKTHWSESLGACWARSISGSDLVGTFFLQIDSHSRFKQDWDTSIINNFYVAQEFWGNRIILTNYPDPFEIAEDGTDNLIDYDQLRKIDVLWPESENMLRANSEWPPIVDTKYGDEQFYVAGGNLFSTIDIISEIPYDQKLYFIGEEPTIAIRAYTRGIKLISPTVKFMYSNYNRANSKRHLHWEDSSKWWNLNIESFNRIKKILSGDQSLGIYGVGSPQLFLQYQKIIGIDFSTKEINP
jgi:hypothetical protein